MQPSWAHTYASLPQDMEAEQLAVSVLGTGPFGRGLAARLAEGGARVWLGTRDPSALRCEVPGAVTVVGTREALRQGRVVVLAVPGQFQRGLPLQELRPGTVVVDCSNRPGRVPEGKLTAAEELAKFLPAGTSLVKAFNTLEESDLVGPRQVVKDVPVASDNPGARVLVNTLVTLLGHRPVDWGGLASSRQMENAPLVLFPGVRAAGLTAAALWAVLHLLAWLRAVLCSHGEVVWDLGQAATTLFHTVNSSCSVQALLLLAAAQAPLVITDYIQLVRGTKYIVLPGWLLAWHALRLQLLPILLLSLTIHAWLVLFLHRPGPLTLACLPPGVVAHLLLLLLSLSLHPAIASFLSRREKAVTLSVLSWLALLLSTAHCLVSGWDRLAAVSCLPSPHQLALLPPCLTLALQVAVQGF
jgi:predicted dinucleotide-binding enzyme